MAFDKKVWTDRASEFPTRRRLIDAETGQVLHVVDVERDEGLVTDEGVPFRADTMNDLEGRIEAGISTSTPPTGTGSVAGIVKLSDSTSSTSGAASGYAATPAAVRSAYNLANSANSTANTANNTANSAKTKADSSVQLTGTQNISGTKTFDNGISTSRITTGPDKKININGMRMDRSRLWPMGDASSFGLLPEKDNSDLVLVGETYVSTLGDQNARWAYIFLNNSPNVSSDQRLKDNIAAVPPETAHAIIQALAAKSFTLKNQDKTSDGFIAQEVLEVFSDHGIDLSGNSHAILSQGPELEDGSPGHYGLAYEAFVPLIVGAMQEQERQLNARLDDQQKQIDELKAVVRSLQEARP